MRGPPGSRVRVAPRLRVIVGDDVALGPGKADLLEAIAETGSIAEAARALEMSYMRAWSLVRTMNACFRDPVVAAARGGSGRGGATLTPTGRRVLRLYREMERGAASAMAEPARRLRRLLAPPR